jgi:ADP-ribose pyrophosphatase YjhB (NUDIX family)
MERKIRVSAGAIIIREDEILLVRAKNSDGNDFLVAPGGGVESDEGINQACIREAREETGIEVKPCKILFVEDLVWQNKRVVKIWFLCNVTGGELARTQGAIEEGLIEARWFRKDQLKNEIVFPTVIMHYDWGSFAEDNWKTQYLGMGNSDFDL